LFQNSNDGKSDPWDPHELVIDRVLRDEALLHDITSADLHEGEFRLWWRGQSGFLFCSGMVGIFCSIRTYQVFSAEKMRVRRLRTYT